MPLDVGTQVFMGMIPGVDIACFGTVSDLDTPDQTAFTLEGYGNKAVLNVPVLQGDKGDTGSNAPLGRLQFPVYDSVDDLPTNLTDDPVDIGKYWIVREYDTATPPNQVGSWWYMWDGEGYQQFREGTTGQAGPVPNVTWSFQLVDSSVTTSVKVTKTGNPYQPNVLVQIYKELIRGPQGPNAAWNLYSGANVPTVGDTLVYDGAHFLSTPLVVPQTKFWTIPSTKFTDVPLSIGTRVPLGSFVVPPIPWDVVVDVSAHLRITGVEADADPLIIGAECRLGAGGATGGGTLVGRGYGNISGYTYIEADSSGTDTSTAADAITPDNGRAVIPANSTGAAATLYFNAFNDGAAGIYNFSRRGAGGSVRAYPV